MDGAQSSRSQGSRWCRFSPDGSVDLMPPRQVPVGLLRTARQAGHVIHVEIKAKTPQGPKLCWKRGITQGDERSLISGRSGRNQDRTEPACEQREVDGPAWSLEADCPPNAQRTDFWRRIMALPHWRKDSVFSEGAGTTRSPYVGN